MLQEVVSNTKQLTEEKPVIKVGSTVTYKDSFGKIHTYKIVKDHEMDISKGKISASSPLAKLFWENCQEKQSQ